jgi:hypothetical protein
MNLDWGIDKINKYIVGTSTAGGTQVPQWNTRSSEQGLRHIDARWDEEYVTFFFAASARRTPC